MEPTIMLKSGTYYVGDLGFVLPNEDLRLLLAWVKDDALQSGYKILEASTKDSSRLNPDFYWITSLPNRHGTVYDHNNKGFGFDWGCFGALPWEWITCTGSYENNKIEFTEPFECLATEDSITIGHLHFTFNPK
jgi:hypothetical protein